MRTIKTVGVIGAGTMGSALAQKFAQQGFKVILCDTKIEFVEKGMKHIQESFDEAVQKKVFMKEEIGNFLSAIIGTTELSPLQTCDIIIEAIYENFDDKSKLFKELNKIVSAETIIATNTSSFSVTELSNSVISPKRFIGLHYFYHAAKNRLVEIIPGNKTSEETIKAAYRFSILSGKDPIYTKDVYGFAINRFFVPWLNEAVKLFESGIGTTAMIDFVCMKTFGIGMGPFALMNATGIPIAHHAQRTLESFGPSYKVAELLEKQVEKKENWLIGNLNLDEMDPVIEKKIVDRMIGCVFFVCNQVFESEVCSAIDLNKGAKIGLKWKRGPVDLMLKMGEDKVKKLAENYCRLYNDKLPAISSAFWEMDLVLYEKTGDRAIIIINRPEDLNALNEEVVKQLEEKFSLAENDLDIKKIFLTGSGKAFMAGADIKFFVNNMKNHSLDKIVEFTKFGQTVFEKIDKSKKKVIAILNGMALGGGLELALCADTILAVPETIIAFPETSIGIYPGLGGTQRTSRRIGKGLAKYLILTGKKLSATEALECGLIDKVISLEDMFNILDGKTDIPLAENKMLKSKWKILSDFYTNNNYKNILSGKASDGLEPAEIIELSKTMRYKAPIAMQIADELIEQERGPASELEKLITIFSTNDALLGLSSINKKVEFGGN